MPIANARPSPLRHFLTMAGHVLGHVTAVVLGFVLIIVGSALIIGQPGMGVGDVKLGAMIGAFLGWKLVLLSILLSVLIGGPLAAALLATGRKGRKDPVPFGPFLAMGGMISLFCGNALLAWYFGQFLAE